MADLALIKKLREATGCGISDCNKALAECGDDFEKSVDWLRKKGLSSAVKKSGRVTSEGAVAVFVEGKKATIVEVNSETDFVSRNKTFQNLVEKIAQKAINCSNIEQLKSTIIENGKTVEDLIVENIATIGENLSLRRMQTLKINDGVIASYVHNATADGMGKIHPLYRRLHG